MRTSDREIAPTPLKVESKVDGPSVVLTVRWPYAGIVTFLRDNPDEKFMWVEDQNGKRHWIELRYIRESISTDSTGQDALTSSN